MSDTNLVGFRRERELAGRIDCRLDRKEVVVIAGDDEMDGL
jgi:hypothetical protein